MGSAVPDTSVIITKDRLQQKQKKTSPTTEEEDLHHHYIPREEQPDPAELNAAAHLGNPLLLSRQHLFDRERHTRRNHHQPLTPILSADDLAGRTVPSARSQPSFLFLSCPSGLAYPAHPSQEGKRKEKKGLFGYLSSSSSLPWVLKVRPYIARSAVFRRPACPFPLSAPLLASGNPPYQRRKLPDACVSFYLLLALPCQLDC